MIFSRITRSRMSPLRYFFLGGIMFFFNIKINAQFEAPTPPAQVETLIVGSLVIPMDTVYQRVAGVPGYFNLKAYGLVNELLQNEIPVKWAIKAGKTRAANATSIDFTANVTRVYPDTNAASNISFRNGPFIIDSAWVTKALPIIASYGNSIFVYKLNANTAIDVRYNLSFKPRIILLNGNGFDTITVHVLTEAGIAPSTYKLQTTGQIFVPTSGYSLASDAHYVFGNSAHVNPLVTFVNQYGGNLIANCAAIGAYENNGLFLTTGGIDSLPSASTTQYPNPDLPIAQFLGNAIAPYGEFRYWNLRSGSAFKTTTLATNVYHIIRGSGVAPNYMMSCAKLRLNTEKGSNVFYLPGHDYYSYNSGNGNLNIRINGRRIFLNSVFIPPNDSTNVDFTTDVLLKLVPQSGFAVKNEDFVVYVIAKNVGRWRAKKLSVQVPFPPGLTYQSHICGYGTFNNGTGVWSIDSLTKNQTDTLCITFKIAQLGNIVYPGIIQNESLEFLKTNNNDTLRLFGVSRPIANIDTMIFFSPLFQDINSKGNDTDEDGGPFGNSQIVTGPFNGTGQIMNGDTIRYTLTASGFSGIDSLLYVTCDQYPLCDTNWLYINVQFPLPITLFHFSGSRANGFVDLDWSTLTEKDNDYFFIERKTNNSDFEVRGKIKGSGNSNILKEYKFRDTDNSDPVNYYRLRQVDFNGQQSFSPVIALSNSKPQIPLLKLFPNPVKSIQQLMILMQGFPEGEVKLQIEDITGRIFYQKMLNLTDPSQINLLTIDKALEPGCYVVTLNSPFNSIAAQLIIN